MRNLNLLAILSFILLLASCSDDSVKSADMTASHDFLVEDIMGNQLGHVIDTDGVSITRNGFGVAGNKINGKYVVNSASGGRGGIYSGLAFTIDYSVEMEEGTEGITEDMFAQIWEVDKKYDIVTEGFTLNSNSLYYGVVDGDKVIQYVSSVNVTEGDNYIKILSQKYIGNKEDSSKEVYEVELEFSSRMVNTEDPDDVLFIKDGTAIVRVVHFPKS